MDKNTETIIYNDCGWSLCQSSKIDKLSCRLNNLMPIVSRGNFQGENQFYFELQGILSSIKEHNQIIMNNNESDYKSFILNKHKRFFSLISDKYYFLSSSVSINDLEMQHFDYFNFIKSNYESSHSSLHVLFSYTLQKDKLTSYNTAFSVKDSFVKISPNKGSFPNFYNLTSIINTNNVNWRFVKSNQAQSFYTCFVFALIETWITHEQFDNVFAFALDLFRLKCIYPVSFNSFDYTQFIIMLNHIYDYIQVKNDINILDIFINYFNSFDDIESILILYVKHCVYMYLQNTLTNNNTPLLTYFDYEDIISLYTQPSLLVIELLSHIFNITINIHYPQLNSTHFDCLQISNGTLSIELCYLKGSYHVLYVDDTDIKQYNCLRFYPSDNEQLTCVECNNVTPYIQFNYNDNQTYYCKNCLFEYIKQAMKGRAVLFKEHNYLYQELFTSPITLAYDINITDTEVFYCFNVTLSDLLLQNIELECSICKQLFHKTKLILFECSCLYCTTCVDEFVNIELSKLEGKLTKDNIKNMDKIQCHKCAQNVNINDYIHYSRDTVEKYESIKSNFFQNHCCLCGSDVIQNNKVIIWNIDEFEDKSITSIDQIPTPQVHLLCVKCLNKKHNELCLICKIYHCRASKNEVSVKKKKCKCVII